MKIKTRQKHSFPLFLFKKRIRNTTIYKHHDMIWVLPFLLHTSFQEQPLPQYFHLKQQPWKCNYNKERENKLKRWIKNKNKEQCIGYTLYRIEKRAPCFVVYYYQKGIDHLVDNSFLLALLLTWHLYRTYKAKYKKKIKKNNWFCIFSSSNRLD